VNDGVVSEPLNQGFTVADRRPHPDLNERNPFVVNLKGKHRVCEFPPKGPGIASACSLLCAEAGKPAIPSRRARFEMISRGVSVVGGGKA
jgi:hypothetical protein